MVDGIVSRTEVMYCVLCGRAFTPENDTVFFCPSCAPQLKKEKVDHPRHYGGDTVYEVIKVLEHWLTREEFIGAMKFNIHKYLARAHMKGGLEDIQKANWYVNYLADYMGRTK